jgi:hypothetical protein
VLVASAGPCALAADEISGKGRSSWSGAGFWSTPPFIITERRDGWSTG